MATNNLISPIGTTLYARVQTPDTKYDATGVYHLDLLVDPNKAATLVNQLETALENFVNTNDDIKKAVSKGRQINQAPVYEEMSDGTFRFKFKQRSQITARDGSVYDKKVAVFDAKLHPLKNIELGNGSTVKVSFNIAPYFTQATRTAGVSLRLVGVQVLDLVEFGDASSCGFEQEEGFECSQDSENTTANDFEADEKPVTPSRPQAEDDDAGDDVDF